MPGRPGARNRFVATTVGLDGAPTAAATVGLLGDGADSAQDEDRLAAPLTIIASNKSPAATAAAISAAWYDGIVLCS